MVVPSERSRLDHDDDGSDGCGATQQDFLPVGPGVGQTVGSNGFGNFATFDPNTPGNPLYLTLFRRYSSTQGRWLSPDPAGLGAADPANPQSWNRYAYVLNNPINVVDPLGLACYTGTDGVIHCISTCGAACAGGGGAGGGGGGAALRPARYSRSASGAARILRPTAPLLREAGAAGATARPQTTGLPSVLLLLNPGTRTRASRELSGKAL